MRLLEIPVNKMCGTRDLSSQPVSIDHMIIVNI